MSVAVVKTSNRTGTQRTKNQKSLPKVRFWITLSLSAPSYTVIAAHTNAMINTHSLSDSAEVAVSLERLPRMMGGKMAPQISTTTTGRKPKTIPLAAEDQVMTGLRKARDPERGCIIIKLSQSIERVRLVRSAKQAASTASHTCTLFKIAANVTGIAKANTMAIVPMMPNMCLSQLGVERCTPTPS